MLLLLCLQSLDTRPLAMHAQGSGIYEKKLERLHARNITIDSTCASYKYFLHVEEDLRFDLTFKESILDTARQWLKENTPNKWKNKKIVRVIIHVRRTSFTKPHLVQQGWSTPTTDYFRRSMSYFTNCLERVQFIVISDDQTWCMTHINATNIVYSTGHSPIVDMAIASLCDHAIITVGTYGWWAAWFANGVTVTQKNVPRSGSLLSNKIYRTDHYKPDWIGL